MLMRPSPAARPVPAEALVPTWRGREPYAGRIEPVSAALAERHPGLAAALAALPFKQFEAAWASDAIVRKYNEVPAEAAVTLAAIQSDLRAPWLCALMLWHIGRFEEVFAATGLDEEFALHYADSFHRILDQIDADRGFADLAKDSFLKDLWLARVVMIPAFAQVWWPHSGLPAKTVLRAGSAAAAHVFLRCGGRRPFLEGHTHDPVAKAYWNEAGWGEALRLAALALPAMPEALGVFGTAWFYDPEVRRVTPRLSFAQDLQIGRGGFRMRVGSNEGAIANATATSASRRELYEKGEYLPTDYAIIWSRRHLIHAYGA